MLELALEGIDIDTKDVTKVATLPRTSNVYTREDACVHIRDNVCVTVKTWGDLRRYILNPCNSVLPPRPNFGT